MTNYNKKVSLGNLGERLVADLFNGVQSSDLYNPNFDLLLEDGSNIEVKTQYPFKEFLTVAVNQLPKCLNCDRLIFVEYDHTDFIKIYECTDRTHFTTYTTKHGKTMAGWNKNKMTLLWKLENPELAHQMQSMTNSKILKRKLQHA